MRSLLLSVIVLLVISVSFSQPRAMQIWPEVWGDGIYGDGGDTIEVNSPFAVSIYVLNDDNFDRVGMSIPLAFFGTGDVTLDSHWSWIEVLYYPWFLPIPGPDINWIDWDGILPDTMNFTLAWGTGLPPDSVPYLLFWTGHQIIGDSTTVGEFCIDSVSIPNQMPEGKYDWLFDEPSPSFNGPHCWWVGPAIPAPDIWPEIRGNAIYGNGGDTIEVNSRFLVDIHYKNYGFTRTIWKTPFLFSSTGNVATLTYQEVYAGPDFYDMCAPPGPMAYSDNWEGTLPDQVCIFADGSFPGDGIDYQALRFEFEIEGDENTDGLFCIDKGDFADDDYDWLFENPIPDFDQMCWPVAYPYSCGDINHDGSVNLLDITYLISYLYKDGPAPPYFKLADVNANCVINLLDITYLISYLYKGGPAPQCPPEWPCGSAGGPDEGDIADQILIEWESR